MGHVFRREVALDGKEQNNSRNWNGTVEYSGRLRIEMRLRSQHHFVRFNLRRSRTMETRCKCVVGTASCLDYKCCDEYEEGGDASWSLKVTVFQYIRKDVWACCCALHWNPKDIFWVVGWGWDRRQAWQIRDETSEGVVEWGEMFSKIKWHNS